ncbi:hypothetical protein M569_07289, partial [Genlisea aurea]
VLTYLKNRSFKGFGCVTKNPTANFPFNEQQLKQLRAQCLVFLSFRNGLVPKAFHLEIALGNTILRHDGGHREQMDQKGKEQLSHDSNRML